MLTKDRIVAVGLLTQRDLDVLGTGFHRLFPVTEDDAFAELVEKLNKIDSVERSSDQSRNGGNFD